MRIRFREEAANELREAVAWYRSRSPRASRRFARSVGGVVRRVLGSPERWAAARDGVRAVLVRGYSYRVVYRIRGDEIEIVAVSHTSRRPGHWRDR